MKSIFVKILQDHKFSLIAERMMILKKLLTYIINESIGTYDPLAKLPLDPNGQKFKDIKLDSIRAKYWLGVGAQPSDPMWRLLSMAGLIEPKHQKKHP
ncbi:Ribosomal protein S16, mitochondrial [Erysiphe neolycopersici]|uniref:Ribosomal protein S16, mitochondrial n=1 Tax=Erysiphe neolycopersici TaxID=212602 RepID=A0A420HL76_9PEZI|nr:Ribosomal protein S16, mitochondrial [Erysiphe neolycopersici]